MRFAILLAAAVCLAAPAFAQRVIPAPVVPPTDQAPPPEGFYKDIPNMYDLLARPEALSNFSMARDLRPLEGRRICPAVPGLTDAQRKTRPSCRTEKSGDSLKPPAQRKQ
jgi:hypothetical protein